MVITLPALNEQEGDDECVTRRVRIFAPSLGRPRQTQSLNLTAYLVEEAMADDSAEIEPGLLGNSDIYNAEFFTHAALTSVKIGTHINF